MTPGLADLPRAGGARGTGADFTAVASLDEPTRRRIYDHVRAQNIPLGRDEVAEALQIARQRAAFHLDRLAEQGLLSVTFARRSGRSGPGAGRPAKLYQRSAREVSVSLPPRQYDLAGRLLAASLFEAEQSGQPVHEVLDGRARDLGFTRASEQPGQGDVIALMEVLENHGYEPQQAGRDVVLHNCPFHTMAQEHAELVCGMNLRLVQGVVDGLGRTGLRALLDPSPGRCCVRLEPADKG